MQRRGFLAALAGGLAAFGLTKVPKPAGRDLQPVSPDGERTPFYIQGASGQTFRLIQAETNMRQGDLVTCAGGIIGIAASHLQKGEVGFLQISGPAMVRVNPERFKGLVGVQG